MPWNNLVIENAKNMENYPFRVCVRVSGGQDLCAVSTLPIVLPSTTQTSSGWANLKVLRASFLTRKECIRWHQNQSQWRQVLWSTNPVPVAVLGLTAETNPVLVSGVSADTNPVPVLGVLADTIPVPTVASGILVDTNPVLASGACFSQDCAAAVSRTCFPRRRQFIPKIHDTMKWLQVKLQRCRLVHLSKTQAGWHLFWQLSLSSYQRPVLERKAYHLF